MPTLRRILDSPVQMLIWSMLLGISHQASAQTASPAPAANSPAAVAAQQGLSESVLRQAQGPYRMILNSPTIVVRPPNAAATPVRTAEPVAVQSIAMAPLSAGPLAREKPAGVVSSTNRKLNSAVIAAVGKWVYQPLEAVRRVEVAIEFKND